MGEMEEKANKKLKKALLLVNVTLLVIGSCGGPMVMRLYFIHGGHRVWLSSWLQTGGWPLNFIPLLATYLLRRRKEGPAAKLVFMGRRLFIGAAIVGLLSGFDNYFYAYGVARLPVSTSSLLAATHLTFIALFAFVLVKQKFTPYSINAVVLLTVGAGVLALHTSSDRPKGESSKKYYMGFFMTVAAAVLYGFILPFTELTYKKARQGVTYTLVLEFQLVMSSIATLVCTIGMIVNNDFKAIPREARDFGLGEKMYYVVLVCSGIIWQCAFLGSIGVTFVGSSILSAVIITVALQVTEVLAVIFYKENFTPEKGVALVLTLWGFVSYFYGELKHSREKGETKTQENDLTLPISVTTATSVTEHSVSEKDVTLPVSVTTTTSVTEHSVSDLCKT